MKTLFKKDRRRHLTHSSAEALPQNMWTVTIFVISICISYIACAAVPFPQCEISKRPYMLEDSDFCDKYYTCHNGKATEEMCDDGLLFDPTKERCELPHAVRCGSRTKQQNPRPTINCPRRNGMFSVGGTCDKFYHCTDGQHTLITCPPGVIFEPSVGACVHADQTNRPNCSATQVLDFICPSIGSNPSILRFGDHDRLAHPKSCRHFYMCLLTGMPRLGGCTFGLVFNPVSGRCDKPKNVPGCEKWYGEEDLMEEEDGSSKPGSAVSPSLSSKISTSSASLSPSAEPVKLEPIFKPDSQPLRRLSAGTNRFSRTQHEANMDSSESNSRVAL